MLKELMISVVSGLIVAVVSGIFSRGNGAGGGKLLFAFLLGAVFVFFILAGGRGHFPHR